MYTATAITLLLHAVVLAIVAYAMPRVFGQSAYSVKVKAVLMVSAGHILLALSVFAACVYGLEEDGDKLLFTVITLALFFLTLVLNTVSYIRFLKPSD